MQIGSIKKFLVAFN